MKILIKETDLKNISEKLYEANEVNRKKEMRDNNYISLTLNEEEIVLSSLQTKKEVGRLNKSEYLPITNLFNVREEFKAELNGSCLNVVTFVDLHGHTGYSLLDGMNKLKNFQEKTVYSRAITDHGVMFGCVDFYKEMKGNHKKPIIGFEAYTETIDGEPLKRHLVLLAKNEEGYNNISKLSTLGNFNYGGKFPQRPIVKYEYLRKHSKGVICLSACIGGEIPQLIIKGDLEGAKRVALELKSIFGEDFYLEVQRHDILEESIINEELLKLGKELGIKVVATTDTHYTNKEDSIIHEVHLCNQTGKTFNDVKRYKFPGTDYHMHTIEEIEEKFSDIPEVIYNSLEIVDKCNFDFKFGEYKLPKFPLPVGETEETYLKKLAWEGFYERFPVGTKERTSKEYLDRMDFELQTILNMGFPSYFLIVQDFMKYAKNNNYPLGPGRGSACGALVSFCLKITEIDPIPYDLLFERFLNPDRKSMPDIDNDLGHLIREDVIDYCKKKYGAECVSNIITFGTLSAKCVVRDVAKIIYPDIEDKSLGTLISSAIPTQPKIKLKTALESYELKELYDTNSKVRKVIEYALVLEGLPKSCSQHACGLIICDKAVHNYCPQVLSENEDTGTKSPTIQYTMETAEEIGLLKIDFLGLKTMTVLDEAVKDINNIYKKDMTIEDIPLNNPYVYEHIAQGHTTGVFQLESDGMTSFMKNLFQDVSDKIKNIKRKKISDVEIEKELADLGNVFFERLIAGISLYRPGPIDEIPNYIKAMLDPAEIHYDTVELEKILSVTYGILVYQEQVILAVRELANFSKGQADLIRKAMSKKKTEILNEYKEYFIYGSGSKLDKKGNLINIKGCMNNGIAEDKAIIIWDKMDAFAKYALTKHCIYQYIS